MYYTFTLTLLRIVFQMRRFTDILSNVYDLNIYIYLTNKLVLGELHTTNIIIMFYITLTNVDFPDTI